MKNQALYALLVLLITTKISAQSSFLDTNFANDGRIIFSFSNNNPYCRFEKIALQSDGKIIAVGSASVNSYNRAAVARFNSDGSLDTTFGNGGEWISNDLNFLIAMCIVIQPDDKIVITGWCGSKAKIVRLKPNGGYDTSFGVGGKTDVTIGTWSGNIIMRNLIIQPDGKFLVSGYGPSTATALIRLNANGILDASFGASGKIIITPNFFGPGQSFQYETKLMICSDNSIIVAGNHSLTQGLIVRLSSTGQLDTSFGANGISSVNQLFSPIHNIFALPSNDFQVLCDVTDSNYQNPRTTLIKFHVNGQIDSTFADNGYAYLSYGTGGNYTRNGFYQTDGKVVAFGVTSNGGSSNSTAMCRFNQDGTVDSSFGINGIITAEYPESFWDGLVQPDGKILAVQPYVVNDTEFGHIRRYLSSNSVGVLEAQASISSALLYPNPVSAQTCTIAYELPEAADINIELLDLQGKTLGTLLHAARYAGKQEETISIPADLNNGYYLLNIRSRKGNAVVKILVNR
jgi:uncharacterized delta-60 repeat protein